MRKATAIIARLKAAARSAPTSAVPSSSPSDAAASTPLPSGSEPIKSGKRRGARKRTFAGKPRSNLHQKIWRAVDGAVLNTLDQHPEYVSASVAYSLRRSIAKRVAGVLTSLIEHELEQEPARLGKGGKPADRRRPDIAPPAGDITRPSRGGGRGDG